MKVVIFFTLLVSLIAFASCKPDDAASNKPEQTLENQFNVWAKRHSKKFKNEADKKAAFQDWQRRKERVDKHNADFASGKITFKQKVWKHSDLSRAEKRNFLTGAAPPKNLRSLPAATGYPNFPPGPDFVNWTAQGLVGDVQDQGWCGSCWAFSAAGLIEAVFRRNNISNATVSSQQMVDCSKVGTWGCSSGWPSQALNNGVAAAKNYPYLGDENKCTANKTTMIGNISTVNEIPTRGNETWLKNIVANVGPVGCLICVEDSFFDYSTGVYYEPKCCQDIQHAVIITGYGTDPKGGDYWLIKNSWGTSWGEHGFAKMARNRNNSCNVAFSALWAT